MKDRIKQMIDYYGFSVRKFEQKISVSNGRIQKIYTQNTYPSIDVLSKIASNFPQINLDWLITGRGEMLRQNVEMTAETGQNVTVDNRSGKKNNTAVAAAPQANAANGNITIQPSAEVLNLINAQQATIAQQAATISNLSEVISRYVQRIDNE